MNYVQPYGIGGFLKGIGSLAAGALGFTFGGPMGAALASGLFTGLTEKDLKKGILSGLTAFVGGKALGSLGRANPFDKSIMGGIRGLGVKGAANVVGQSLTSPENVAFLYPQMGNLAGAIDRDRAARSPSRDPYFDQVDEARRKYTARYGNNPYASLYGYRSGALVKPYRRGGPLSETEKAQMEAWGMNHPIAYRQRVEDIKNYKTGVANGEIVNNPYAPDRPYDHSPGDENSPYYERPNEPDPYNPDRPYDHSPPEEPIPEDVPPDVPPGVPGPKPPNVMARDIPSWFVPGFMPEFNYFMRPGDSDTLNKDVWKLPSRDIIGINPFDMPDIDALLSQTPDMLQSISDRFATEMRRGGMVEHMAEGGAIDEIPDASGMQVDTELINAAAAALMGQVPPDQAEKILAKFVAKFGEGALEELKRMVASQQESMPKTEGMVSGPGGGMDDMVPASVTGSNPIALSAGEYIVPADVTSMIGDGDSRAGAQRLDKLVKDVRKQKTGTTEQAQPIGILSLA